MTRIHSSRMRTTRSSSHQLGGGSLPQCMLGYTPWVWGPGVPPGVGLDPPPRVWAWRPSLWPDPLNPPPGCGPGDPPGQSPQPFARCGPGDLQGKLGYTSPSPGDLQGMLGYHLQGMLGYPPPHFEQNDWQTHAKTPFAGGKMDIIPVLQAATQQ